MMIAVDGKIFNGLCVMLRYIYGLVPIIVGLDKFFNYTVNWNIYVSPLILAHLPVTSAQFVMIIGIIEIIAGCIVLSSWTRFGAYLVSAWLLLVVVNLLTMHTYFDIALRDLVIALGYGVYGTLVQLKETSRPA